MNRWLRGGKSPSKSLKPKAKVRPLHESTASRRARERRERTITIRTRGRNKSNNNNNNNNSNRNRRRQRAIPGFVSEYSNSHKLLDSGSDLSDTHVFRLEGCRYSKSLPTISILKQQSLIGLYLTFLFNLQFQVSYSTKNPF